MREQESGTPPIERKKVSVKVNGKEEGRNRLSGNGRDGGKSIGSHSSSIPAGTGRLKGESSIHNGNGGMHQNNEALVSGRSVVRLQDGELAGAKRKAAGDGVLLQWGRGKRSRRCSRIELSKHDVILVHEGGSAVKSSPLRSQKKYHLGAAAKNRFHGTSKHADTNRDDSVARYDLINRRPNNSSIATYAVRHNGGEAKHRPLPQPMKAAAGNSSSRQQQLPTTTNGQGHCNDNRTCCISEATALACNDLSSLKWPRIILVLTRKEKEDDFLVLKGNKLLQRPKKRPKVVEKALLYCTPGYWLNDLSHGRYDVREKKNAKKNPGGLRAMESVESDSE